jgi:hypothetical protein
MLTAKLECRLAAFSKAMTSEHSGASSEFMKDEVPQRESDKNAPWSPTTTKT